jgi:hypothetical protein
MHIMRQIILASLVRQARGTELLCQLLREEHALLREGQPDKVAGQEMSIQELIRQLVREREFLAQFLVRSGFPKLAQFLEGLDEAQRRVFETWRAKIIAGEQESALQSSVNADLAMALWKQSGALLSHFQNQVTPKERNTYTAKGTWRDQTATATLVRGRL